jgi:predicted nucleotidyltransferase
MSIPTVNPTLSSDVDALIQELLHSVQRILGSHLIGLYLDGSLASGDFDQDSDIDFVVVTDEPVSENVFLDLQAMHERIVAIDSPWALRLEGSYMSQSALRHADLDQTPHPTIGWGSDERLKMAGPDETWDIHRWVLRERGVTVVGPAPQTLIDPVSPDALRRAIRPLLCEWLPQILNNPQIIASNDEQSYTVFSLCRILYSLQHGEVVSKHIAARWAQLILGEPWKSLIQRTWVARHNPNLPASAGDVQGTLDFIRFTLEHSQQWLLRL